VCRPLQSLARHLFTTRAWTLGSSGPADDAAWAAVADAVDVDPSRLLRLRQVHGTAVVIHRASEQLPASRPEADIAVTDDPSIAIAIQTADCVPLLLADRRTGAVAAAHAGWRGLAAGVPGAAVAALADAFGGRPDAFVAAVGPCISAASYEVGEEVAGRFAAAGFSGSQLARWFSESDREGHWQFDGWQAARDQLEAAGISANQIHLAALCTAEFPDLFCSYRRDGKDAGRIAAVIRRSLPRRD
jgi:YfiH family protein